MSTARRVRNHISRRYPGLLAPGDGAVLVVGTLLIVGSIAAFWGFATTVSPDIWVPILVLITLLIVSIPIVRWLSPGDTRLRRLLILALVLKLLAVWPRYLVNEITYGGNADSGQYHVAGQTMWQNFHDGKGFTIEGAAIDSYSDETRVIGLIAGGLYLVVGTSKVGGYLAFSWVCWLGLVMFFRSFRIAFPNAPPYLAAGLIFFLPSMLYWPSSLGKDAIMVFCIGWLTLGIARLLTPAKPLLGVLYLIPSAALMLQVRPHLLLVALTGVAVSMLARNSGARGSVAANASRVVLLIALGPMLLLGLSRMDSLFGSSNDGNNFTVASALDQTKGQTTIGGSAFETRPVSSPIDMPVAIVSVIYRPFPFEVRSVPVLISALEGSALLLLTFAAGRWIWMVGIAMYRHPFTAYCGGYVLAFVFAFSNVGNAGILARQRVQMFPVLMLLVAATRECYRTSVESSSAVLEDGPAAPPDDVQQRLSTVS